MIVTRKHNRVKGFFLGFFPEHAKPLHDRNIFNRKKQMNTKALVKGVRGNAKIAKAFAGGVSKGLAKGAKEASKGLGPVLAALSVAGLIGGELADRGLLSIPVMGKRLPVIGTGLAIISIALGIYMRKRPISRVFYSMGVTFGVCQVIDVIKYGFVVKAQSPAK